MCLVELANICSYVTKNLALKKKKLIAQCFNYIKFSGLVYPLDLTAQGNKFINTETDLCSLSKIHPNFSKMDSHGKSSFAEGRFLLKKPVFMVQLVPLYPYKIL